MSAPPRKSGPPPRKQNPLAQWIYFGEHPNNQDTLFCSCARCGTTVILASGNVAHAINGDLERKRQILEQMGYNIMLMPIQETQRMIYSVLCKFCKRRLDEETKP